MGGSIRRWLVLTFAAAVLLIGFVGGLAYRTTTRLVLANQRLMASHSLVEHLTYLRLLIDDAESGARGYALTGRKEYLEPYHASVAQVDSTVQTLRHDLAESPELLSSFEELPPLIESRLRVSEELIAARQGGNVGDAVSVTASGRGKELMDKIRERITALQQKEQNLLLERERESRQSARRALWSVLVTSAFGVIILAVATTLIWRTIRQRETVEAALRRAEAMQRAILDGTNHAIISTDAEGRLRTINATGLALLGYSVDDLAGQSLCVLHDGQELRARAEELNRSMSIPVNAGFEALSAKPSRGIAEERNWTYVRRDGSRLPVRVAMTALRDATGAVSGYVVIVSDMSERRAVERMKDEFISVVSHELRTPLTSIKGALGLLAGGALHKAPERAGRMLRIASENTNRLMRLVNDILDFERLQSGQLSFDKTVVGAAELMHQAADSVRALAETSGVDLEVRPVRECVHADEGRMVQSFTNLLANAIKFSPAGGLVEFAAEVTGSSIVFRVSDHGRGIPAEKLDAIFERFQQVDASDSRDKGGTGLGLAITRSIVQQHGGEVWANSEVERGSNFFIRLPVAAAVVGAVEG